MFFLMLALLPGCRPLFPPEAAYIKNNYNARNSKVWEESVSSMNTSLKQFAAGSACRWAGFNADKIKETMALGGNPESYYRFLLNNYGKDLKVLGLTENSSGICTAALYSFYDNISEQLKLFKNKTGQSEIKTQKVAAAAGEDVKQQEAGAGQTESQGSDSPEQQNQQTSEQAENFTTALLSLINNTRNNISYHIKYSVSNYRINNLIESRLFTLIL